MSIRWARLSAKYSFLSLRDRLRDVIAQAGDRFKQVLVAESPLQIVGVINANHALLAEQAGYKAIYLSGGGLSAGSLGVPDLGITNLEDVLVDVRRIVNVSKLPLLVDIDTGFGPSAFNIARTISSLIAAGAAAAHIEDQVSAKRCGHRPNKKLVSKQEMMDRITAAKGAVGDNSFVIMARTDAIAVEGVDAAIDRAKAYVATGASMLFIEAVDDLKIYQRFADEIGVPILANITEFGMTPLYTIEQLKSAKVSMALYPLSAFRAMNKAANEVYQTIRSKGSQQSVVDKMQTRDELYQSINYYE
jgi:methylisocitrate lyase